MPAIREKVRPVTSSHPPQTMYAARRVSVRGIRPAGPEADDQQDQGAGDEPGDLAADLGVEHPGQPGGAPHAARAVPPAATADRADLVAGDPAEPVVAQGQLEDRVALRAADVGAGRGGDELDDGDPPAGRQHHRGTGREQVRDALAQRRRRRDEVGQGERRDDHERLQHLGEEAEADEDPDPDQPPRAGLLDGAERGVGAEGHQQHEQRVGVVEPEHHHGDRGQREHRHRRAALRLRRTGA